MQCVGEFVASVAWLVSHLLSFPVVSCHCLPGPSHSHFCKTAHQYKVQCIFEKDSMTAWKIV